MSNIKNLPDAPVRVKAVDVSKWNIRAYDVDNGYPQRMLNMYNASGSAKMCANLCAAYLIGKGFEDLDFYKAIVNDKKKGNTPDKILRRVASDKARLRGYALHINYNALYEKVSVDYVPFEMCREGIKTNKGKIGVFKFWFKGEGVARNTENDEPQFIHLYDPRPEVIEAQAQAAGGWDVYNGQIIYISEDFETYPLAVIDPVLDDVEGEIESAITRKNNLRNNFQLKHIWIEKGQGEDDAADTKTVEGVRDFMGPAGKSVTVIFSKDPDGKDVPTILKVESAVNDKLFQYTDQTGRLNIYTQYGQPAVLHSDYLGASGFNEGQLPQSMEYYNSTTEPGRIELEEVFREAFSNFAEPINPTDSYRITSLEPLRTSSNQIKVEEEDTRSLIEIIGIGGVQALQAILADVNLTDDQKRNTLEIVFGLTPEKAQLLTDKGLATV